MFVDKAKIYVKAGDGGTASSLSVVRNMYRRVVLPAEMAAGEPILFSG